MAVVVAFFAIAVFAGYASMVQYTIADSELKTCADDSIAFLGRSCAAATCTAGDAGTAVLLALEGLPDQNRESMACYTRGRGGAVQSLPTTQHRENCLEGA